MKKLLFLVLLTAVCAAAASVWGHEFFVIPGEAKEYKAGDTVLLNILSTHYFTVGEEIERAEVNDVYIVKNGQRAGGSLPLIRNDERRWHEAGYRLVDNNPVIVAGVRKGGFYSIFTDGSIADGTRSEAAAANPDKTVAKTEYFAKYAKLYLNPAANDATFSTPLGHELEIIPLDNPARIRAGSVSRAKYSKITGMIYEKCLAAYKNKPALVVETGEKIGISLPGGEKLRITRPIARFPAPGLSPPRGGL